MNKHQCSIKPALLAATIAATVLASAANGQTAPSAGASGTVKAAPVAQDQRTPVVTLSETVGDLGMEIFDGKTPRYSIATLPKNVDHAIVYIDVDSPNWNTKETHAALKLAKDLNWPVMAESSSWDVPRLHAFLKGHFPSINTAGLQNVAVRVGWNKGRAVATDTTQSDAAVEVGKDYLDTSEGIALAESLWRNGSPGISSRAGPQFPTGVTPTNYAIFAWDAYLKDPYDRRGPDNLRYFLQVNLDVLKVWATFAPVGQRPKCIVAWKGSTLSGWGGDWLRNLESQIGKAEPVATGSPLKIGKGYMARYNKYKDRANQFNCQQILITGHSLGGGMAQTHAYFIRLKRPNVETYNSARVGNSLWAKQMRVTLETDRRTVRLNCRWGDPVAKVPFGLESFGTDRGCNHWSHRLSTLFPWRNHDLKIWIK